MIVLLLPMCSSKASILYLSDNITLTVDLIIKKSNKI
jgi:hypothetical protein